ncbi:LIM and calponin homology domains-containing protein 1-like isoform X2 [Xenopus laevis]|uniref:LIM and calponin homology domains-containing protein 1-like isoform X2 n=2 Tax=Xenopus laevis TaxID=8355 RepID=A0A1L8HL46_XENLA|nr:LIM and calponin homology domains-containing protein 1-like isoform X2 [Xenopus laevis]OCT96798.1 hypothetical protein XELAEV_18009012mg [Xenopus laevis]
MASSDSLKGEEIPQPPESPPDTACREAQKWIEQVTGKSFGDRDFRTGLENGILLCELLNAIKPGLVKKINRLPTPIAGLDNITLFLRGCKELGLKESQLFDPGDLQDTANRTTGRTSDCNRKLRNVLITLYWLGRTANGCSSYSGTNLDLKEFEGLLAQMRKENEEIESPKRSIRDSGYIDCWDSERSDSLSPPRHGRDDSFDSLDSFGSRSQQTPSPDVVLRGSSDGKGSDSESDLPHRRIPDVRKDDMSARRVSYGENKAFVPFNQYLPNRSNQTAYIPAPLRKKKAEREDYRKSWSTATSPLGGERPFSPKQSPIIKEEQNELQCEGEGTKQMIALKEPCLEADNRIERIDQGGVVGQSPAKDDIPNDVEEVRKCNKLQQAGIKVLPATSRYSSQSQVSEVIDGAPDIVLRKENAFLKAYEGMGSDSEEEEECKIPDVQRDDLATRRARMNQPKSPMQFNQYIQGSYLNKTRATGKQDSSKTSTPTSPKMSQNNSAASNRENQGPPLSDICKEKAFPKYSDKGDVEAEQEKIPDIQKNDLAKRKAKASVSLPKEPSAFAAVSITKADMETWQRLQVSSEDSEHMLDRQADQQEQTSGIDVTRATNDDFGRRKLSLQEKRARNKQKFVHFGPVTEIDQQKWDRLCIAKAESGQDTEEEKGSIKSDGAASHISASASAQCYQPQQKVIIGPVLPNESRSTPEGLGSPAPPENASEIQCLETQRDDMMARRKGSFQKLSRTNGDSPVSNQYAIHSQLHEEKCEALEPSDEKQELFLDVNPQLRKLLLSDLANTSSKATSPVLGIKPPNVAKEAEDVKDAIKEGDSNTQKDPDFKIPEDNNAVAPDPKKDDMMTRKISVGQKPSSVSLGHFLPVPFSLQRREEENKQTSGIISSTIKPKNAAHVGISDVPSKPLNQKETEEHSNLAYDVTRNQGCNSVEARQQDGLERETIQSPDLTNADSKTTIPALGNTSPAITKEADVVKGDSVTIQQPNSAISKDNTMAPDPEKDDMMTRRISVTQKPVVGLGHFLPVPFSLQQKAEEKKSTSSTLSSKIKSNNSTQAPAVGSSDLPNKPLDPSETEKNVELPTDVTCDQTSIDRISDGNPTGKALDTQTEDALETCDHELFRFSPRSALSDDTESMSMCDMRYEEEGSMLPHSKAHYDHLEQVNSLLKEEDDTWQNDLARWKTRRRSASQDLIKKEEERKKIERLMSGETELSERRKSIKTYREIVKEKERRERELHEAYKNAKTRDEAEHILQSYIEKFTISEAVLEGLVMPTFLEKSQSVEPSLLSSSEDPNPLKYLREQSLPSPKYTSTVEATVFPSSPCEAKSPTGLISPSKNISSKTVPMLTAKPYSQPKNTQEVLKTFKVDGKVNLNGVEEQKGKEHESQTFAPSLTQSQMFEGVARVDAPVVEIKKDIASIELNLARPNNLNLLHESKSLHEDSNHINQEDEPDSLVLEESLYSVEQLSEGNTQSNSTTQDVPAVSSIEIPPLTVNGTDTEDERKVEAAELIMHWSLDSNYSEAKENSLQPLKSSENVDESSKIKVNVDIECTEKSPALVPNLNSPNRFCTWDPEEERKRQEKWQQEQERLLQERYQKEQEKLKEEWEKAQKEVEEEERKYYEEERKIIEDTVVPITLSPNSNVHFNISERNGNFIPALTDHAKRDQENNNEKLMAESNRAIKSEIHTQSNVTQQQLFYTQEGSMLAAEETQIKGKTEKRDAEPCNHVQSNECNTPTRLTLQAGFKQATSSESGLPGDLESLKTPVDENAAHQNMSSLISTRGTDSKEGTVNSSQLSTSQCQSPNRSVSGKKLCSTCGLPLGKGAAMIIETLSLYFHIQCFKCGLCKGQLGDTITGTDVRIRNGLLNCNDCYIKSRTAGHPTPL